MELVFYCATRRRTDVDNLGKTVADALNGMAYTDDCLVEELHIRVRRRDVGEEPRTEIHVYEISDEIAA